MKIAADKIADDNEKEVVVADAKVVAKVDKVADAKEAEKLEVAVPKATKQQKSKK